MSLRVNNNITALIAHRNLTMVDFQLQKSIERLSSGLRINRAADDPSNFITSEKMRTQIEGINQAITNTVDSISLIQTAEGTFDQIESLIRSIRTLTLHAVNTGPNDTEAIAADQIQIQNAIQSLQNIATTRKYGSKVLLDGGLGRKGTLAASTTATLTTRYAVSYGFTRTDADSSINSNVITSGTGGTLFGTMQVNITTRANFPRQAIVQSRATFADSGGSAAINVNETLTINGVQVKLTSGMNIIAVKNAINAVAAQTGASAVVVKFARASKTTLATFTLNSTASNAGNGTSVMLLRLYSRNAGTQFNITVTSDQDNSAGKTSGFGNGASVLQTGRNAVGALRVRYARASGNTFGRTSFNVALTGKGNILSAADQDITLNIYKRGLTKVNFKGLSVQVNGNIVNTLKSSQNGTRVGASFASLTAAVVAANSYVYNVAIAESPLYFQLGPNKGEGQSQLLSNMQPGALGLSGRLSTIDVRSLNGANSALTVVDEALSQVLLERGRIGAFQKQFLESTKENLAVYRENYAAAESNIRDTDVASEMITFTRTQILMQSGTAMLAQANLAPQSVLQLLR